MNEALEFKDAAGYNYLLSFPVKNTDKPLRLRLWVEYEIGGYSYSEFTRIRRGYYLYISVEESCNMGIALESNRYNTRILLGEVRRKSESACRDFSEKAAKYGRKLVEMLCADLEVEWEKGRSSRWSGEGNRVGMWSDVYYSLAKFDLCSHV